jgi:predicted acetyltransferase
MNITTYRELQLKNELLPLMDQAFWWPFNPQKHEEIIKIDPRLKNSPVGYCALENNHVVGFVGVMDLATRTLDGTIELAGGIWGVATLPSHARKGISTALMQKAHQHFQEQGYRFSFLNTSPTLIAYAFYKKLGYTDATEYPSAYKIFKKARTSKPAENGKKRPDWKKILKIYSQCSIQKTGFVVRDEEYLKMLEKRERIQPEKTVITETGYVLLKGEKETTLIREIITPTIDEANQLIDEAEKKAQTILYDRVILDNKILKAYRSRGYMVLKRSYGVLMVKPLRKSATFRQVYGDKFYMSNADSF